MLPRTHAPFVRPPRPSRVVSSELLCFRVRAVRTPRTHARTHAPSHARLPPTALAPQFTIGHAWVTDYGSADEAAEFEYLLPYSPLHNVRQPEVRLVAVVTNVPN